MFFVGKEDKKVKFNEEVAVLTVQFAPEEVEIDESKIDDVLQLIQNADPTGEIQPDGAELLTLEGNPHSGDKTLSILYNFIFRVLYCHYCKMHYIRVG